jgi:hypothetical protein
MQCSDVRQRDEYSYQKLNKVMRVSNYGIHVFFSLLIDIKERDNGYLILSGIFHTIRLLRDINQPIAS